MIDEHSEAVDREAQLVSLTTLFTYLVNTRVFWHDNQRFSFIVRDKLCHFSTRCSWPDAGVFMQRLFPVSVGRYSVAYFEGQFCALDAIFVVRMSNSDDFQRPLHTMLACEPMRLARIVNAAVAQLNCDQYASCEPRLSATWNLTQEQRLLVEHARSETGIFVFSETTNELVTTADRDVLYRLAHTDMAMERAMAAARKQTKQADHATLAQADHATLAQADHAALHAALAQAVARAATAEAEIAAMVSTEKNLRKAINDTLMADDAEII